MVRYRSGANRYISSGSGSLCPGLDICSSMIAGDQKSQWKIRRLLNSNPWRHDDARYMEAVVYHA
jgi:hypothetical protein